MVQGIAQLDRAFFAPMTIVHAKKSHIIPASTVRPHVATHMPYHHALILHCRPLTDFVVLGKTNPEATNVLLARRALQYGPDAAVYPRRHMGHAALCNRFWLGHREQIEHIGSLHRNILLPAVFLHEMHETLRSSWSQLLLGLHHQRAAVFLFHGPV
jgi:hypothetical protein